MKLMLLGDKIIGGNSAYSKIGFELCNRLTQAGHKVAHIPTGYANHMGIQSLDNGVRIYESGNSPFSEDVVEEDYIHFKADMLISLKETWCFNLLPLLPINYVPHCIIDHEPLSPLITYGLGTTYRNIAITRFGQRMLKNAGFSSTYIPHGVDTTIFKPIPEHKKECRKLWFLDEDSFVIGIIARNQARKMIPRMLRGFKRFKELNPTVKTQLMLWTNIRPPERPEDTPMGIGDVSVDLVPEMVNLGILPDTVIPDVKLIKHGIPDWSGDDYKSGWDMVKMYGAMDVLLNCTPSYTRIWTETGLKRIKFIKEGDSVLTHDGTFKRVQKTYERPYSGNLIRITTLPKQEILLTPDHPVYILRKGGIPSHKEDYVWVKANEVEKGQHAVLAKPKFYSKKRGVIQLSYYLRKRSRKCVPSHIHITRSMLRLFAYYLSEGTATRRGQIIFSLGPNDENMAKDIQEIFSQELPYLKLTNNRRDRQICLKAHSIAIAQILRSHFGGLAYKKKLPPWLFYMTDERHDKLTEFIKALWLGDGYISNKSAEFTTVSRRLAENLVCFLMKLGYLPTVKQRINKPYRKSYAIRITGRQLFKFAKMLNKEVKPKSRTYQFWRRGINGNFLLPVINVDRIRYNGKVHNLKVEDNESYCAPLVVHNCTGGEGFSLPLIEAQACGKPVITTDYAGGAEQVGAGLTVRADDYVILNTPGTRYMLCDTEKIAEALTKIYNADREKLAKKARSFALRYDWNVIIEYWKSFLTECETELHPLVTKEGTKAWD